jgi:hypothetical protein
MLSDASFRTTLLKCENKGRQGAYWFYERELEGRKYKPVTIKERTTKRRKRNGQKAIAKTETVA